MFSKTWNVSLSNSWMRSWEIRTLSALRRNIRKYSGRLRPHTSKRGRSFRNASKWLSKFGPPTRRTSLRLDSSMKRSTRLPYLSRSVTKNRSSCRQERTMRSKNMPKSCFSKVKSPNLMNKPSKVTNWKKTVNLKSLSLNMMSLPDSTKRKLKKLPSRKLSIRFKKNVRPSSKTRSQNKATKSKCTRSKSGKT